MEGGNDGLYWLLLEVLIGHKPIGVLLEHSEFQSRARRICRKLAARTGYYEADDLFQDACVKVLRFGHYLRPNNIPDTDAFFKWFFTLTLNLIRDESRKNGRFLQKGWSPDVDIEKLCTADPSVDIERDCLIAEFLEFIETLPEERRRAITHWLDGCPYREIEKLLGGVSHVTIRKWVRDSIDAFFNGGKEVPPKKAVGR